MTMLSMEQIEQLEQRFTFRKATIEDLDAIFVLNNELDYDRWDIEKFKRVFELDIPIYLAIDKLNEAIVSCIIYLFCLEEVKIVYCMVSKAYRRSGIAANVFRNIFIDAYKSDARYALLEVRVSNVPAINLYTKLGFRIINLRPNYYTDFLVEDAYVMEYRLTE